MIPINLVADGLRIHSDAPYAKRRMSGRRQRGADC